MKFFEEYATGPAVLAVVFLESVVVAWFYGETNSLLSLLAGQTPSTFWLWKAAAARSALKYMSYKADAAFPSALLQRGTWGPLHLWLFPSHGLFYGPTTGDIAPASSHLLWTLFQCFSQSEAELGGFSSFPNSWLGRITKTSVNPRSLHELNKQMQSKLQRHSVCLGRSHIYLTWGQPLYSGRCQPVLQ